MAILKTLIAPDPILNKKAELVESVDEDIKKLMDDMLETMYHDNGVGLAANQVGILKRIMVLDLQNDDDEKKEPGFYPIFMANPVITDLSEEKVTALEGCISVPLRLEMSRHASLKIKYLDYNNNVKELAARGWLARAIQHEVDHLDGKLTIDYLSSLKKDMAVRKLIKLKKNTKLVENKRHLL